MRGEIKNPADDIIKRAVELSRQPGRSARESGAGRGGVATNEDVTTTDDGDGYTIHTAMTELDFTDDAHALTV